MELSASGIIASKQVVQFLLRDIPALVVDGGQQLGDFSNLVRVLEKKADEDESVVHFWASCLVNR